MRRWGVLLLVALSVFAADQVTKYLAVRDLTVLFDRAAVETFAQRLDLFFGERGIEHLRTRPAEVFPWWRHTYTENPGAGFGLLRDGGERFRLLFFSGVFVLASSFVVVMAGRIGPDRPVALAALGGILGGVAGNFMCRATRGYVIDFIDWHLAAPSRFQWPTFNLADAGITAGVVVLLTLTVKEVVRREA